MQEQSMRLPSNQIIIKPRFTSSIKLMKGSDREIMVLTTDLQITITVSQTMKSILIDHLIELQNLPALFERTLRLKIIIRSLIQWQRKHMGSIF